MMRQCLLMLFVFAASLPAIAIAQDDDAPVRIGSKTFTESVILGEMIRHLSEHVGTPAVHREELGGTGVLWNALINDEIDIYPEYTGTLMNETLLDHDIKTEKKLRSVVRGMGLRMTRPLGFNNTYAIGMRKDRAKELGITKISDLREHPSLKFGFNNEFLDRGDGWPSLRKHYDLPQTSVRGMHHDLTYRALDDGSVDAMDLYATDAEIAYYDLAVLEDDLAHFPIYNAVIVYRADLELRAPELVEAITLLEGALNEEQMSALNERAKIDGLDETVVAADFVEQRYEFEANAEVDTRWQRIARHSLEHLGMVLPSMLAAVLVAMPLGIWAAKQPQVGQGILGIVGIIQTVPSLALLVILMQPLGALGNAVPFLGDLGVSGIGEAPAIVALFLYSLLPIVRNTCAGLQGIAPQVRESAIALGLPAIARLWRVELPIAGRTILAGIKTAAVINIGFATLGALIGADGYGRPILTGIRRNDYDMILEGAIPAAAMALVAQGLFELAERLLVSRGLRLRPAA